MKMPRYIAVKQAAYVSGYKLRLRFDNGFERVVDFGPFLKNATNPMLSQYRRPAKFKQFHLDHGDLMWGDYEMIFPVVDLYRGEI